MRFCISTSMIAYPLCCITAIYLTLLLNRTSQGQEIHAGVFQFEEILQLQIEL